MLLLFLGSNLANDIVQPHFGCYITPSEKYLFKPVDRVPEWHYYFYFFIHFHYNIILLVFFISLCLFVCLFVVVVVVFFFPTVNSLSKMPPPPRLGGKNACPSHDTPESVLSALESSCQSPS